MMAAVAVGLVCVALVAGAALVAWRWWLVERRLAREQRDKQRDEVLATLEPRVRELENAAKQAHYSKLTR